MTAPYTPVVVVGIGHSISHSLWPPAHIYKEAVCLFQREQKVDSRELGLKLRRQDITTTLILTVFDEVVTSSFRTSGKIENIQESGDSCEVKAIVMMLWHVIS